MYVQKLIDRSKRKGRPSTSSGRAALGNVSNLLKQLHRRGGLGVLLAGSVGGRLAELRHRDADGEERRVMGSGARDHLVDGRPKAPRRRQLLKRRLGMLGRANLLV